MRPPDTEPFPRVLRISFVAFLVAMAPFAVAVFLQNSSVDAAVMRVLMAPFPFAAACLGVVLALDLRGSAATVAARSRRQRVPHLLPPHGFARFMGALFAVGGAAWFVAVLTRPIDQL